MTALVVVPYRSVDAALVTQVASGLSEGDQERLASLHTDLDRLAAFVAGRAALQRALAQAGAAEARIEATCPECGKACRRYDTRTRTWRHLDTMQYRTLLTADVPRVECTEHGVKQVQVPWALPGSRFTAMLEALVIDWLKESSTSAVARLLGMSWDEVDGVMRRAVARGLGRRKSQPLRAIGLDETSFQRRHEYVTVTVVRTCNHRPREGRRRRPCLLRTI